jgi:hypothetical protein
LFMFRESEDTILLMLKETYGLQGIAPIKPGSEQRQAAMFPRPPGGLSSPMGSMPASQAPPTSTPVQSPPIGYSPAPFNGNHNSAPIGGPAAPPPLSGFVKK